MLTEQQIVESEKEITDISQKAFKGLDVDSSFYLIIRCLLLISKILLYK